MSPRQDPEPHLRDPKHHLGSQTSQDKERHEEEIKHHPEEHPNPYTDHHPQAKQDIRPEHDAHTNIPHDDLPPHQNAPSPIRPSKRITEFGRE
ncbi:MAG: hypothetical protein V1862_13960 [Methanobacteriota archaeon]